MRDAMDIVEEGRRLGHPWHKIAAQLRCELPGIAVERVDQIRALAGFSEDARDFALDDNHCAEPVLL